jgi:hypothetical protein
VRRRPRILVLLLVLAISLVAASPSFASTAKKRVKVTFIGDSVPAALDYVAAARAQLTRGLDVKLDLRVCRRLASLSCPYQGSTPASALDIVRSAGASIGDVLVIDVGYNEGASTYRDGMRQIIRTAVRDGVKGIVWVTLRETRDIYHWTNVAIYSEAKRWPQVRVADWNRYSSGRPWFGGDGLHLNSAGAAGLVALVRPLVVRAAQTETCGRAKGSSTAPSTCKH